VKYRRRLWWRHVAAAVLILGARPVASWADEQRPRLDEILRRAGAATVSLEDRLAVVSATEEYHQGLLLDRDNVARVRREIVSEVVWVPTGDAMVWAFFRDVVSVDGTAVVDRANRLQELFASGATRDARQQAARLLDESARYNLGRRRTVNTPTLALSILHPRGQSRFRFTIAGEEKKEGLPVVKVRFAETARPTLSRTSSGTDVPARGSLWIEPAQGALVASELRLDVPRLQTEIKVRFRQEDRLGAWLPFEMKEAYGNRSRSVGEERVEATAQYSNFRRAEVEVKVILPGP
jgi:hypothetical protein